MISETKSDLERKADAESAWVRADTAFTGIQSYAILKDGEFVGSVSFKWPRKNPGSGRVQCFVFSAGEGMVSSSITGFHGEKATVAVSKALSGATFGGAQVHREPRTSQTWQRQLEAAGFSVHATIRA